MSQAPIFNASSVTLDQNPGTLPNVTDMLADWFQPIIASQVTKTQVNFQTIEQITPLNFAGVIIPNEQDLEMAAKGEREWIRSTLFCYPSVIFNPDDVFFVGATRYRVLHKRDATNYGYIAYAVVQDYNDRTTPPPIPSNTPASFDLSLVFTTPLHQTVTVFPTILDAFASLWRVYDSEGNLQVGAVQVLSETQVKVTVAQAGTYKLVGVS